MKTKVLQYAPGKTAEFYLIENDYKIGSKIYEKPKFVNMYQSDFSGDRVFFIEEESGIAIELPQNTILAYDESLKNDIIVKIPFFKKVKFIEDNSQNERE